MSNHEFTVDGVGSNPTHSHFLGQTVRDGDTVTVPTELVDRARQVAWLHEATGPDQPTDTGAEPDDALPTRPRDGKRQAARQDPHPEIALDGVTKTDLMEHARDELDLLAPKVGLDPADYSRKEDLADAILDTLED